MERPAPVYTANAPAPGGPYSQAMLFGNLVFAAGQLGLDPATGEMVAGSTAAQAERALLNLSAVLTTAGSSLGELIKTTIFLTDMDDFPIVNEVYERLLVTIARPGRRSP